MCSKLKKRFQTMGKQLAMASLAALLAGTTLALTQAFAEDPHGGGGGFHGGGFAPMHGAPPGHVLAVPRGFHGNVNVRPFAFQHRTFADFTPAERTAWTGGWWHHGWWHGRWGWWWFAGGYWWWYDAPVYPYPTYVSDVYYVEPTYQESPAGYWYYCSNPPGYYPYVQYCNGPWQPVAPTPPARYQGPAEGPAQGPPAGYQDQGAPPGGPEQGPPPGYDQGGPQGGPPPAYPNQGGPPPGYDQGPPNGGPPPGYGDQGPPPGDDQGPAPSNQEQGPPPGEPGPPGQQ